MVSGMGAPPWSEISRSNDEISADDVEQDSNNLSTGRILMTGSRDWTDEKSVRSAIRKALSVLAIEPEDATLIHGAARGADTLAATVAKEMGLAVEAHPARWNVHSDNCPKVDPGNGGCWQGRKSNGQLSCRRAGFRRNQEMIDSGADILIAFIRNQSKGATGTLDLWMKGDRPHIVCRQIGDNRIKGKVVRLDTFD